VSVILKPEELGGLGPLILSSHENKIFIVKLSMKKYDPFCDLLVLRFNALSGTSLLLELIITAKVTFVIKAVP
jgi:hypothetical protein